MQPLFSVIIPTRDRIADLDRCLQALTPALQGLREDQFEVIVSDDARADALRDHLAERFPKVRWVAGPAAGPAANRNHGARQAGGRWLVFTDDDCIPCPGWLGAFARSIEAGQARALEGRVISDPGPRSAWDEAPLNPSGGCFWSCNIAVEARAYWDAGGFDEGYPFAAMEDVDLRAALTREGAVPSFVPEAVINHPARSGDLRLRLSRLRQLRSQVYYRRKWSGPHPMAEWLDLSRAIVWHWFWVPLRRGSPLLAAVAPLALAYMTVKFPRWYRDADLAVEGRRERLA